MPSSSNGQTPVEQFIAIVKHWPEVSLGPHGYNGAEFLLDDYEFGHIHHGWRGLHINYPRRMRDILIEEGRTSEHTYFTNSGWTNYQVDSEEDIDGGLWLLRLSYLYRAVTRHRKPVGQAVLAAVDVESELDELGISDRVRTIFDDVMEVQAAHQA